MAYTQYLTFEEEHLPLPDSYEVTLKDIISDSSGETEAGTTQRDIIRTGIHSIQVSFSVTLSWLNKLSCYRRQSKIQVIFFDFESNGLLHAEMYMENFQAKLVKDTSYGGLWSVSFKLNEL